MPLITHTGSVFWRELAQRTPQIQSNVNIYDEAGKLRILAVEELDSAAKQLRPRFFDDSRTTLAVGRVLNADDSVTMVVSTNNNGALGSPLRTLVQESNWESAPRLGTTKAHAETRMIAWAELNGYKLEAIGVSHSGGICLSCYADMLLRGIYPASPFNTTYPLDKVADLLNSLENWIQTNEDGG